MYDVRLVTDDIKTYEGYISQDICAGFKTMSNRFMLAAYAEGRAVGVCVFDAAAVTRIEEISITADCKDRDRLRRSFLAAVLKICEKLGAKVLTISLYDEDGFKEWEKVLDEYRFVFDEKTDFYRFSIDSMYENMTFAAMKRSDKAVLLGKADEKQIEELDRYLKSAGLFADLKHERIRRDLSSVHIEDGKIEGMLLISDITDGICVEYVYVSGNKSHLLPGMIQRSLDAVAADRRIPENAVGETACLNKASQRLFLKLFPEYEKIGEQRTYFTAI